MVLMAGLEEVIRWSKTKEYLNFLLPVETSVANT